LTEFYQAKLAIRMVNAEQGSDQEDLKYQSGNFTAGLFFL
jgi:hypothetical protein